MYVTETEAGSKECRALGKPSTTWPDGFGNRVMNTEAPIYTISHCTASRCMHWRWKKPQSSKWEPVGYCGLAGKPD
jgi:hypothetical protein